MRAIIFDRQLKFVRNCPRPRRKCDEALVRVLKAGVCNTDLEIIKGYMGFRGILGHEFVGVVERAARRDWVGQRVAGEINCACGSCGCCARGLRTHCPRRSVLGILNRHGAFADFLTLPLANLHRVPDSVGDDEAVFVEPLAAAFQILEQVKIGPSHNVAVLGDGKLGLLAAQVLHLAGAKVTAVGRHSEKLAILERRGIRVCLRADGGQGYDVVVDCTGLPGGFDLATRLTRPRGTLVLKSTAAAHAQLNLAPLVINEVTLIGSRCGPFPPALAALARKRVDVLSLISARYPLERGLQALKAAARHGALKVLIEMASP